jgi:hypothetical protein
MKVIRLLLVAGILLSLGHLAHASQGAKVTYADLFQISGKVIAKGTNTTPVGPYGVKTYRVEELTLAPGTKVDVNGTIVVASSAWRVTIVGTSFQARDLPPIVSIDSTDLLPGLESANLQEISAITFDKSLIRDGAALALSYGNERTDVPERVKLATAR